MTKTEREFMMRNFERIERTRERETQKNWARAIDINNDDNTAGRAEVTSRLHAVVHKDLELYYLVVLADRAETVF